MDSGTTVQSVKSHSELLNNMDQSSRAAGRMLRQLRWQMTGHLSSEISQDFLSPK